MLIMLPAALAVIGSIKFMVGVVDDVGLMFSGELAIRSQQIWFIHRPLLDRMLFLVAMVVTVSSSSKRIEGISVWMQVVPGG